MTLRGYHLCSRAEKWRDDGASITGSLNDAPLRSIRLGSSLRLLELDLLLAALRDVPVIHACRGDLERLVEN